MLQHIRHGIPSSDSQPQRFAAREDKHVRRRIAEQVVHVPRDLPGRRQPR